MTPRRLVAGVLLMFLALLAGRAASAHEAYRVVGTLVKVDKAEGALALLTIRFKWEPTDPEDELGQVYVTNETEITRDGKKVPLSDVKAGLYVVIDAWGDEFMFSDALSVKIVPPPAK
jgi:hypothetical protein